jgi:mannose-6-phosphate isomerase-like protein (cupin superfamily)
MPGAECPIPRATTAAAPRHRLQIANRGADRHGAAVANCKRRGGRGGRGSGRAGNPARLAAGCKEWHAACLDGAGSLAPPRAREGRPGNNADGELTMQSIIPTIGKRAPEAPGAVLLADPRQAAVGDMVSRPWGSHESIVAGEGYQVKRIIVAPGRRLSLQYQHHRSEHWTIVAGAAHVTLGADVMQLMPDESVYIPLGAVHRIENRGTADVVLIEVQCGSYLGEDDIVRLEDDFDRR